MLYRHSLIYLKVSVRLPYEEYKHVKTYEVNLSVVANLIILPGEAYLMVGDVIKFKIIYVSGTLS